MRIYGRSAAIKFLTEIDKFRPRCFSCYTRALYLKILCLLLLNIINVENKNISITRTLFSPKIIFISKFWEEGDGDCFDIELFTSFDVMSGKDGRLRGR